ncbi:MAG: hydrogenase/urease accessory protein HupE [Porticoccaceae bacterium]|jgi:hydrogenase/urease accessory protein HupE
MQVADGFLLLGVEHIAFGLDHLLFVLALLMLMPNLRRLVWTITAFTAGHSITQPLVALGFMRYPLALVEIAISQYLGAGDRIVSLERGGALDSEP